jgi:hypothetical protein
MAMRLRDDAITGVLASGTIRVELLVREVIEVVKQISA